MQFYYVYVLFSLRDHKIYTGFTTDLRKRVEQHNNGINNSTRCRRPLVLIYYEAYLEKVDAKTRELFLKSGRGREVLNKQIKNTFKNIKEKDGFCQG